MGRKDNSGIKGILSLLGYEDVMGRQRSEIFGVQGRESNDQVCEQGELSQKSIVSSNLSMSVHTFGPTYLKNKGKGKQAHHGFISLHSEALQKAKILPKHISTVKELY
eukprot:6736833-Ditylum_brightwellii.AAC.1